MRVAGEARRELESGGDADPAAPDVRSDLYVPGRGEFGDEPALREPALTSEVGLDHVNHVEDVVELETAVVGLARRDGDVDALAEVAVPLEVLGGMGSSNHVRS